MKKNIVIIHYNTPYLTECLVRSINLFVEDANIYIFDNSDEHYFTAKFDNVTILDNTKGKYINFDEWLNKYPNKHKSHGRVNNWGSAKHCYSVEKCMEILDEPFILLDSDILLKKDISDLFNEEYIYIGETIKQPLSEIHRVQPFLCYINTNLCKENKVHYFDDNHMHGLRKTAIADMYDTGAAFYINASKYKHKDIKFSDYVIHYGHGSWDKEGEHKKVNPKEWLAINKRFWSSEKNKKVVYTCITGSYDTLRDPLYISEGFDYICFTDNLGLRSNIWQILPLPAETKDLSQVKKQRYVKINAHKVLTNYDLSVWVDGNVDIKSDLNRLLKDTLTDDISVYVPQHPSRNCIYEEASAVIAMKKDKGEIVNPQMNRYKKEGFPKNYGLLQSNIMIRKHNNADCIKLMESWFNELKDNSHRDQLSFNYVLWKNEDVKVKYLDKFIYKSVYFKWNGGHARSKQTSVTSSTQQVKSERKGKIDFHNILRNSKRITTHRVGIYN